MLGKLLTLLSRVGVRTPRAGDDLNDHIGVDDSAANLMVVLRESKGANKPDEALVAMGKATLTLSEGKEVEVDPGWFSYIGDMHVRFVFDGAAVMRGATTAELARLGLTPEAALAVAVANIKRVYGAPRSSPLSGLMEVTGGSPDLDSSYFLDGHFWSTLLHQHPDGVVAMVPKRGSLLYAPLADRKTVERMRASVSHLHETSGRLRVSSALFLFRNGRWSVFEPPTCAS